MFAVLAALLAFGARTLPAGPVRRSPTPRFVIGLLLVAFGWIYPHFLEVSNPAWYLIAAPLGLLPCPTLSAVIGLTSMFDLHRAPAWSVPLVVAGLGYGALGVFRLGVTMDVALLAGAIVLAAAALTNTTHSSRPGLAWRKADRVAPPVTPDVLPRVRAGATGSGPC